MTTKREMELSYTEQKAVIDVLLSNSEPDLAARLGRCMTAHRSRHGGNGRRFSCQSAACVWCRRAMIHGWWVGICDWADTVEPCHSVDWFVNHVPRRYTAPPPRDTRRPRSGGATQKCVARCAVRRNYRRRPQDNGDGLTSWDRSVRGA
jgi:hypothetical protein